jgi:predicted NUDIX family NTP pyrophosphohydrolase
LSQHSAGILLYRAKDGAIEVLLLHPGGPFWANKDDGAWSIPKGMIGPSEDPLSAARREFAEETGSQAPMVEAIALGDFRYTSGKLVTVFALPGDFDLTRLKSNLFSMEWPPRSGQTKAFPEADRAGWFSLADAALKLVKGQRPILAALSRHMV